MSCDHWVADGGMGAVVLQTLQGLLEEPAMAMVKGAAIAPSPVAFIIAVERRVCRNPYRSPAGGR